MRSWSGTARTEEGARAEMPALFCGAYRKRSTGSRHRPIFLFSLDSFLSSVGFLPSIPAADWTTAAGRKPRGCRPEARRHLQQATGSRRQSAEPTPATGRKPPGCRSAPAGDHQQNRQRQQVRRSSATPAADQRRPARRSSAPAAEDETRSTAAGRKTTGEQRQQAMRLKPAGLSFFIFLSPSVLLPAPPASLSYSFLSPSVPFHRWVLLAAPLELRVRKRKIFLGMR